MELLQVLETSVIVRLIVAVILGLILGVERVYAHKTAGVRTYAMVALGAALFVVTSEVLVFTRNLEVLDPTRIAAAVVTGIGFLGAGLIILKDDSVRNLTTAAGLWVAAGIGVAAGFGLYLIAAVATLLALFIFSTLSLFERKLKIKLNHKD